MIGRVDIRADPAEAAGREQPTLRRAVGVWGSYAWGYADVGADVYVAVGLVALYAQGTLPLAFLAAGLVYVIVGFAYTELAAAYPVAGGSQYYTLRGLGDIWGFLSGWALLLDFTIDVSLFAIGTAGYLDFFLRPLVPWIVNPLPTGAEALVLIGILIYLNIRGIRESSWLNEVFSAIDMSLETILLVVGFGLAFDPAMLHAQLVTGTPTLHNFLYGISVAIVSYIGLESISQVAQETVRPATVIPRTSITLILTVLVFALGFSTLGIGTIGWQQLAAHQSDPIAAVAARLPLVGPIAAPFTAALAAMLIYASTNTGMMGSSRIAWSMSHFDLLPAWFREIHPRYRTPVRTILVFSAISVLQVVIASWTPNAMDTLANLYAFGALSGYILVLVSLIRLRFTDPYTPRRWKTPLNLRIHRPHRHPVDLPLLVVLGILGNFAILVIVVATHPLGRIAGPVWILIGLGIYVWHRRRAGMPVWRSLPREWEQEQIRVLTSAEEWESLREYRAALARRDAERAHHVEDVS
jgi:APA family basic amino acid/polyamine antiporter